MPNDNQYLKLFEPILKALDVDKARTEDALSLEVGFGLAILSTKERIEEAHALASQVLNTQEGEVVYFREVWPKMYGRLFYYQRGYAFLVELAKLAADRIIKLIDKERTEAERFFQDNLEFWCYYASGTQVMDGQFTLKYSRGCIYHPLCMVIDQMGATIASYKAAWGLAYTDYMHFLDKVEGGATAAYTASGGLEEYTWSCSDADAVEWLYSLQAGEVIAFNGEPADIAHLHRWFSLNFQKDIVNIYDRFKAVRNRKKDRTPFMRRLLEGLEKKMDRADGKFDSRR